MKIKRIAIMFAFLLFAIAIPLWASVGEDDGYPEEIQSRRPMPGENDEADFNEDDSNYIHDDEDYVPQGETIPVSYVSVTVNEMGIVSITVPGHTTADVMAFATDYDIEFFVSPPAGTHFTPETSLIVTGGVEVTFGPVVRSCGRLFFVKAVEAENDTNANEPEIVDIIFYTGSGLLPMGESGSMSGPVGLLVPHGPTPYPPFGYTFGGWLYDGTHVTFPFNASASMTLEAVYTRLLAGDAAGTTFTLTYWPAGGNLPVGEPHTRTLPINTILNNLPTPIREGYMFTGWMAGNNLANLPIIVTSNLELTASWARINQHANQAPSQTPGPNQTAASPNSASSQAAAANTFAAIFNPDPGVFAGGETGLRVGAYNSNVDNIPVPTRSGYTFGGWLLPNGNLLQGNLNLRGDVHLIATWSVDPNAAPTPGPSPTPSPGSSGSSSSLTNPETSPMTISLMIFGLVMTAGVSVIGITKISRKHMAAAGEYRSKIARYNREKRIADLLD